MGIARVPVLLWVTMQDKAKDKEKGMLETEEEISRILNMEQCWLNGVPIRI